MPFLSVVTRTYRRPQALARCAAALAAQADPDYEHLVMRDTVGLGVAGSYALLTEADPNGRYVLFMDDDDYALPTLVADLKAAAKGGPDVIVFKYDNAKLGILPYAECWQAPPAMGRIGGNNVAVKRRVWRECIGAVLGEGRGGPRYESDFYYLEAVWAFTQRIHWLDKIEAIAPQVAYGEMEAGE